MQTKHASGEILSIDAIDKTGIKLFADGATKEEMLEMYARPYIKGLTTNPSLMRKAGVEDYRSFAKDILSEIRDCPISFEVIADDFSEMERQAQEIASWGRNVFVKIPVTNTSGTPSFALIERLATKGVQLNITALMTLDQVRGVLGALHPDLPSFISIFAGRIADTGRDPLPIMAEAVRLMKTHPRSELIWASPREVLNIFHAASVQCPVITLTNDILLKLEKIGYDLDAYSLDTVKMFYDDAVTAGYTI